MRLGKTISILARNFTTAVSDCWPSLRPNRRCAAVTDAAPCIEIALGAQGTRAIGLFRLPVTEVTFSFTGYDETQADALLARIDLHYRRGGG